MSKSCFRLGAVKVKNFFFCAAILFFLLINPSMLYAAQIVEQHIDPSGVNLLLLTITNPSIAYLLLLLGIYGIFFEIFSPGFILPGVIGGFAMLIALYALLLLPLNYLGLSLLLLGLCFIMLEGFAPSFGVLGFGGTIAFILGSMMLINSQGGQVAWSLIGLMATINILFFVLMVGAVIKSRRQAVRNGLRTLIGASGRTVGLVNLQGQAVIRGEIWSVQAKVPIAADKNIKVIQAAGLLLEVEEDI